MKITDLKEGSRVRFTADAAKYGNGYITEIKKYNLWGRIATAEERTKYYNPPGYALVFYHHVNKNFLVNPLLMPQDLELIPESEYEKYDTYVKNYNDDLESRVTKLREAYKNEPKVNFTHRKFDFLSKQDLATNHTAAQLGTWNREKNTFTPSSTQRNATCCAFTKTISDIQVFIPKAWLNYYGYNTYDLVAWFKFLTRCEIGFEYEYLGDCELPKEFPGPRGLNIEEVFTPISQNHISLRGSLGYVSVRFKGQRHSMLTYLNFICIRYLYDNCYWNIPGLAMKIKKSLGKAVTHWQALLMAHLNYDYNGYYNLVAQSSNGTNTTLVNPFQSPNDVIKKLTPKVIPGGGISMNGSFEYLKNAFTRSELDKYFKDEDFIGLLKYIKSKLPEQKIVKKKEVLEHA